jgi:hypothetical protein
MKYPDGSESASDQVLVDGVTFVDTLIPSGNPQGGAC